MTGCDRDHEVGAERLRPGCCDLTAELRGSRFGPRGVEVPDRHRPPARDERARGRAAVDAGADHGRTRRVGTAERLRSEHRRGARAQRGDRACLEHRLERTRLGVRDEHESAHACSEEHGGGSGAGCEEIERALHESQEASGEMRAISWRAQNRLHSRYTRLLARRLQRNKAMVAIARELCGFIWELLRTQSCYQAQSTFL